MQVSRGEHQTHLTSPLATFTWFLCGGNMKHPYHTLPVFRCSAAIEHAIVHGKYGMEVCYDGA